ncbi:sulfotransferase domain-containing protein [Ancylobacter sp.]|uniref:sulfotransferase domain-containing protein n=1 Tax=Ancylobacter sp. TaxID=1872567 RepID=UPI003D127881
MTGLTLIASYPKSGNTWMRAFIASHLHGGRAININADLSLIPNLTSRPLQDFHAGLEHADLTPEEVALIRPWTSRRIAETHPGIYKTHDSHLVPPGAREPAIPPDAIDRAVYLIRDPRDVAVSLAHHLGRSLSEGVDMVSDAQFRMGRSRSHLNVNVEHWLSSWSAHVESWLNAADVRLLRLRYEDMLAEPLESFTRLCRFLELDDAPDAVGRSLDAGSFGALAAQEGRAGFRERYRSSTAPFFRAGRAGGWRETLPPELAERVAAAHSRVMTHMGYA